MLVNIWDMNDKFYFEINPINFDAENNPINFDGVEYNGVSWMSLIFKDVNASYCGVNWITLTALRMPVQVTMVWSEWHSIKGDSVGYRHDQKDTQH